MPFADIRTLCHDAPPALLSKSLRCLAISLGAYGVDVYSAAGTHAGEWRILHAIADSVVVVTRFGVTENLTIKAGDRIYGEITSVSATSGTVELYRA